MPNLYNFFLKNNPPLPELTKSEKCSITYHDFFDYPLNSSELIKWDMGDRKLLNIKSFSEFTNKNGFFFVKGRKNLIYKRLLRNRISNKKFKIAKKASHLLSFLPSVMAVALTGSLAMGNSSEDGDIDFLIITRNRSLWTTRILSYLVIWLNGIKLRKPNDNNQKDRLCLNMWLDESDLVWKNTDRNLYTAHEISQIIPLVNKGKTYEKFLYVNRWILEYWPNAVKIKDTKILRYKDTRNRNLVSSIQYLISNTIEKLAFKFQYVYMKNKISREVITPTRAVFHPQNWGKIILSRLSK